VCLGVRKCIAIQDSSSPLISSLLCRKMYKKSSFSVETKLKRCFEELLCRIIGTHTHILFLYAFMKCTRMSKRAFNLSKKRIFSCSFIREMNSNYMQIFLLYRFKRLCVNVSLWFYSSKSSAKSELEYTYRMKWELERVGCMQDKYQFLCVNIVCVNTIWLPLPS
jgi:hypothetical protein